MKFAVIGAGSWGTTLANLLCNNGHEVRLWAREPEVVDGINTKRQNPYFMTDLILNDKLICTNDMDEALNNSSIGILAIPSGFVKSTLEPHKNSLKNLQGIANVAKGFERNTGRRISEMICDILEIEPESKEDNIACLSGPNIADEVAKQKLGCSVIAAPNEQLAKTLQYSLSTNYFRIYTQKDRTGVELGGTLKNIFAIGAGMVDGLEYGDNTKAAYLTRALHELIKLGTALGGKTQTFYGLAGLGDLMTTSNSFKSRNHRLGEAMAKGMSLEEFTGSTKMVVEGVEATKIAYDWSKKLNLQLPITEELYRMLFEGHPIDKSIQSLMGRELKSETD